jgi:hypothetical protein
MTSSRLYSAVTKYWQRIAAGLVVALGVIELFVGGLTADSGVEFYLMAWAGTTGGLWFLFEKAERSLSEESRDKVAALIRSVDLHAAVESIPAQFGDLFDQVFGDRHASWRCFGRSTGASLVAVLIVGATLNAVGETPPILSITLDRALDGSLLPGLGLLALLSVNAVGDYLSLLETRLAIRIVGKRGAVLRTLGVDLLLTAMISVVFVSLGTPIQSELLWESLLPREANPEFLGSFQLIIPSFTDGYGRFRVGAPEMLFLSAFFTSVWLWLYTASVLLSRVLLRMNSGVGFLLRVTDVERQPFRSMGFVSVVIVSGLFAMGLPLVLL